MSFGKSLLASILGTLIAGIVLFFLFILFIGILISGSGTDKSVKPNSVLKIELKGDLIEKGNVSGTEFDNDFAWLENFSQMGVYEITNAIRQAKDDKNIKGIYLRPGIFNAGWSSLSSIRQALIEFKASGKFIIAYSEIYTEKAYYLATVADKVFIFKNGFLEFNGLAALPMFYKGMFDKLGIEPRVFRVGAFKSAVEPYMTDKMSEPSRRQTSELQNDVWGRFIAEVAEARHLTAADLDSIATNGVLLNGERAVAAKLVDQAAYEDEVKKLIAEKTQAKQISDLKFISLKKYAADHHTLPMDKKNLRSKNKIAVIFAQGQIYDGKASRDMIGSESLSALLREAREDTNVKAVVLRINSPGGSAMASDVIHREIVLTKQVKPVVASMSDLAASGGYYIAAPCSRIFARENTITGSIGVFGVLIGTEKFFTEKTGITFDRVTTHPHADMGNPNRPMDEYEMALMDRQIRTIYYDFRRVVMEGRGYPDSTAVDTIAGGRVWSGKRALELKLVDEIGDLDAALKWAAQSAGVAGDYRVVTYPKDLSPFDQFMESFNVASLREELLSPEFEKVYRQLETMRDASPGNGVYMLLPWDGKME